MRRYKPQSAPGSKPAAKPITEPAETTPANERVTLTVTELLAMVHTMPTNPCNAREWRDLRASNLDDPTHFGGTWDENQSRSSYPQGRDFLAQLKVPTHLENLRVASIRRQRRLAEVGETFLYERARAGYPDCFVNLQRERRPTGGTTIKLVAPIGGNVSVLAKDLIFPGLVAAKFTDVLESAGYRVELWGCQSSRDCFLDDSDRRFSRTFNIPLKSANEPLDIDKVLLVLCCPGFFRHNIFRAILDSVRDIRSNLGRTENAPEMSYTHVYDLQSAQDTLDKLVAQYL